jgi:hypothetical protein
MIEVTLHIYFLDELMMIFQQKVFFYFLLLFLKMSTIGEISLDQMSFKQMSHFHRQKGNLKPVSGWSYKTSLNCNLPPINKLVRLPLKTFRP